MEREHVVGRDHRGLIDDEHRAGERGAGFVVCGAPGLNVALVGEDERGDRLGLDARPFREIGDHLVLEGKARDSAALGLRDARDRLQHGRLTGPGDALDHDSPVVGGQDQRRRAELAGVELPVSRRLEPVWRVLRGEDGRGAPPAFLNRVQDPLLGAKRFLGGDQPGPRVADPRLARDQLASRSRG